MKVDGGLSWVTGDPRSAAASARAGAAAGYDRLFTHETANDPFLPIALAAGASDLELGTNIAVAFARSPMTTASTARDLHELTGGRFVLGLGSQVKAHVERRFSMPWSRPAARMREYVIALRAIWDSWETGSRLDFDGEFYRHTLSSPMFDPGPTGFGSPRVLVAAVGPLMTEAVGEVADGLLCHAFTSPAYLADVTLPALARGAARSGRSTDRLEVSVAVLVATAAPGRDLGRSVERARQQLAFYGSTPAYRGVLEHHGWSDLHEELHALSRAQRWEDMTSLVDDEVLHTMAVVAQADDLADVLLERFGTLVTAVRLGVPYAEEPETWAPVVQRLKEHRS